MTNPNVCHDKCVCQDPETKTAEFNLVIYICFFYCQSIFSENRTTSLWYLGVTWVVDIDQCSWKDVCQLAGSLPSELPFFGCLSLHHPPEPSYSIQAGLVYGLVGSKDMLSSCWKSKVFVVVVHGSSGRWNEKPSCDGERGAHTVTF